MDDIREEAGVHVYIEGFSDDQIDLLTARVRELAIAAKALSLRMEMSVSRGLDVHSYGLALNSAFILHVWRRPG